MTFYSRRANNRRPSIFHRSCLNDDGGACDADGGRGDRSGDRGGDTFVRIDKYRIAGPSSGKSHSEIGCANASDENRDFAATSGDSAEHA